MRWSLPAPATSGELTINSMVHLRARDYDPKTGTFTTRDPLDGVDGTAVVANAYHYADNDPLNRTDPTGMRPSDGSFTATDGVNCSSRSPGEQQRIANVLDSLRGQRGSTITPLPPCPTKGPSTTPPPTADALLAGYAGEVSKHWDWAAHGITIAADCDTDSLCRGHWGLFGPPPSKVLHVSASKLLSPGADRGNAYYTVAHEIAHGATYALSAMKCTFVNGGCQGNDSGIDEALSAKDPNWRSTFTAGVTFPYKGNNSPQQLAVERIADCIAKAWGAQSSALYYWQPGTCPAHAQSIAEQFIA